MIDYEYTILLEGYYNDHDDIEEALFKEFGYAQGECNLSDRSWYYSSVNGERITNPSDEDMYVDYKRCADIDIDGHNDFIKMCKDKNYKVSTAELSGRLGGDGFLLEHSHKGSWYAGAGWKMGYDYMVYPYHFKYKEDLTLFILKYDHLCAVHTKYKDKASYIKRRDELIEERKRYVIDI